MSYEFIAAQDLPTTEAEEVDVLCVENGELKRKAGASLGGGKYDCTIRMVRQETDDGGSAEFELVDGGYDALKAKIDNDEPAVVRLIELFPNGAKTVETSVAYLSTDDYEGYEGALEMQVPFMDLWFLLLPDNTITDDY